MNVERQAALQAQIDSAILEVDRALTAGWRKPSGESAESNLRELRETLQRALEQARNGLVPDDRRLFGMTKWVADWIPEIEALLRRELHRFELPLQG
ncbi:MAG: hypothetical protein ACT4P6_03890 [Gemmatimonadaceae bacterium]